MSAWENVQFQTGRYPQGSFGWLLLRWPRTNVSTCANLSRIAAVFATVVRNKQTKASVLYISNAGGLPCLQLLPSRIKICS